jgi:tetratricopeptide (TPR) repeat protein
MYQKDYILRMIEMLGEMIRAIVGYITRGDYVLAKEKLTEAYLTFLRKDASFFLNIPADELSKTLLADHNYTNGHLEILAELLYAEALLHDSQGDPDNSLILYEKALKLFTFTDEVNRTYSTDRIEKITRIMNRISVLKNTQSESL